MSTRTSQRTRTPAAPGRALAGGAAALVLLLGGCGKPEPVAEQPIGGLLPATVSDFSAEVWASAPDGDAVVARVNGAPITRSTLEAARAGAPTEPAAHVLERLIELEVLAQAAVQRDLGLAEEPVRVWREALVQRYLRKVFEGEVGPNALPLNQVSALYYKPSIRKLYDHADAWRMVHIYFTCCDPKNERCDSEPIMRCFEESARDIQTVYQELKAAGAASEGDADAIVELFQTYRADNELRFALNPFAVRVMPFYYDPARTHDEQKGYNIIAESVARATIEGGHAVIQEPVQSPFGWHVIARLAHIPESRKGPDDPDVIADIRNNALPRLREARLDERLKALGAELQAQLRPELLELLDSGAQ